MRDLDILTVPTSPSSIVLLNVGWNYELKNIHFNMIWSLYGLRSRDSLAHIRYIFSTVSNMTPCANVTVDIVCWKLIDLQYSNHKKWHHIKVNILPFIISGSIVEDNTWYQGLPLFHYISTQSSFPLANPSSLILLFVSFGLHKACAQFQVQIQLHRNPMMAYQLFTFKEQWKKKMR